jgi:dTDP-4-dehydrorhamnose 3,5-epimerase-like enzyme
MFIDLVINDFVFVISTYSSTRGFFFFKIKAQQFVDSLLNFEFVNRACMVAVA